MKNYFRPIILLFVMLITSLGSYANEGMWLLQLLQRMNEAEMKNMGLHLTAEEIYSINQACLKDAIVRLNGGQCTGEVISDKGLVLSNHHCGYDAIQSLSTVENDILTNGFMAKNLTEEKPMEGFVISFLIRIENVTDQVLAKLNDSMSETERAQAIGAMSRELAGKVASEGYEGEVKSFFYGTEFYMMVYETFRDIRLVGNPPESVGKFGGDTDNWMWPRHTGDFSMMRIYANGDNKPADYSADNKPYRPRHSLPVATGGVDEGDFCMVMGYPGRTNRYLTSWGVKQAVALSNPAIVAIRDLKLATMKEHMDADPAVRLKYAAKYAGVANYWKYYIGQTEQLVNNDVMGKKEKLEADFSKWVNGDTKRKEKYGQALNLIKEYYASTDTVARQNVYLLEGWLTGPDIVLFGYGFDQTFTSLMAETDAAKKKEIIDGFKEEAELFFKDYDWATEKDVFTKLTAMYYKDLPKNQQPQWMRTIDSKYKGNVKAFCDKLFATSILVDKNRLFAFLDKPSQKVYDKDLGVPVCRGSVEEFRLKRGAIPTEKLDKGNRLLVSGLREMMPDKNFYPNANSTMRLTYGTIGDYQARDAVHYDYYTTARGIMEKMDNSNPEFVVPDKLAQLIAKKDFGRWANSKGELVTCFISNNDITGGNSGSPVIDGDGNLIGIAFDGNWEAMSGDISFEPELQRTISVDIRYVMFIIDKLMGGKNIIDELHFVNNKTPKKEVAPANVKASVETH